MKKIQILLVLLMVGIPTMEAQNYKMVLKKTDGTTHEFPVEDIMEISMEEIVVQTFHSASSCRKTK